MSAQKDQELLKKFESYLSGCLEPLPGSRLKDAMSYSLMAGGKRIRPLLLFHALQAYGLPEENGFPMAAAIEMVHTYSLIHDDMPEMDNDDLRRGRPSCHKAFGQDIALLAGDALQSLAFETIAQAWPDETGAALCALLAKKAGAAGMCLGQDLDLGAAGRPSLEQLEAIESRKTGCLIELPLCAAAILAGRSLEQPVWNRLGRMIGIQFQIQDDLLEKTSSPEIMGKSLSDERNEKATALSLYSLEQGQKLVEDYDRQIRHELKRLSCNPEPVEEMVDLLLHRKH